MIDPKSWRKSIDAALLQRPDANGLAILTGTSGLFAIDVDNDSNNPKKLPGTELWNRLIDAHGKPKTLKARTASGGFHYVFKACSPESFSRKNFSTVKVGKDIWGIDGRSLGGCIFAEPTTYVKEGHVVAYEWLNGPPSYDACKEMPGWLAKVVQNHAGDAMSAENPMNDTKLSMICAQSDDSSTIPNSEARSLRGESTFDGLSSDKSLLLAELSKLLKEKANDTTSTYASSLPHGLYGTYFCYQTRGPRKCYLGHQHNGSNNFNLLKRGRNVWYRCHGQECSHKPPKKLGELELKAALQDARTFPVNHHDDMRVITQYTRGTQEVQELLLRIVVEHAAPQAYANLGRLFAYIYMIEGRLLATRNNVEKNKDFYFYVWNGSSWMPDSSNLVASVFTS
jgi:hypothetical protein